MLGICGRMKFISLIRICFKCRVKNWRIESADLNLSVTAVSGFVSGGVVLITGAGRGIGAALVHECVARGAKKIYATDLNMKNLQA